MAVFVVSTLLFASAVTATFDANLNYASPSRRHASLGIDVPKLAKRSLTPRAWNATELNFTHGVASGDPYPNSVILWTRISPTLKNDESNVTVKGYVPLYNHDTEAYIKASPNPICVEYQVGRDKNFSSVADHGTAYTTSDIDYTVKVIATSYSFENALLICIGGSEEPQTLHPVLLPVLCLRFQQQQKSSWTH
jgi:alkaline phosphatase D